MSERVPANRANYYYLSNDEINLEYVIKSSSATTLLGVANSDFLHVLGAVAASGMCPHECIVFDNNPAQLAHMGKLLELIDASSDRYDYLERLLCIRLGNQARRTLNGFNADSPWLVPGAAQGVGHGQLERKLWRDIYFDQAAFETNTSLKAKVMENGLILDSNVVGDMDTYMLTILCVDTREYDSTPFSVRFGYGYLASDRIFAQLKALLTQIKPRHIHIDAAHDLVSLLLAYRYERLLLWVSNIFTPYFIERYSPLGTVAEEIIQLAVRVNELPQLDIGVIGDGRISSPLSRTWSRNRWQRWRMTPHYKAFSEVRRWLLDGPAIEIVNVPSWVEQDQGISKLPATSYVMLDEFLNCEQPQHFETAFLHILLGHGASERDLQATFAKAKSTARRILVLEHNSRSLDFLGRRNMTPLNRIVQLLGQPSNLVSIPGLVSLRRNWLLVYEFSNPAGTR